MNCLLVCLLFFFSCHSGPDKTSIKHQRPQVLAYDTSVRVIHVFVALCDNKYQGIAPVPAAIGNGQDADHNLYWGAAYGIKSFFKASRDWQLIRSEKPGDIIKERLVFKHRPTDSYLVADAYDGQYIKACTQDFLCSNAGRLKDTLHMNGSVIGIGGNASLLCYIGHDGLMEFSLWDDYSPEDTRRRDCMILACYSREYFGKHIKETGSRPLLWTTGLMSPEAYTLHDAIAGYLKNERIEEIRQRAAKAYSRYQKCSGRAAWGLLVSG